MAAPKWQAGHVYLPGDLVQPIQVAPTTHQVIPNAGFESGDTDWNKTNFAILAQPTFAGSWLARMTYTGGANGAVQSDPITIAPGQSVTVSCMLNAYGVSDQCGGQIRLTWEDSGGVAVGTPATGNQVTVSGIGWRKSQASGVAPAGAAKFRVQAEAFILQSGGVVDVDAFALTVSGGASTEGLVFKAVQAAAGTSGAYEPTWPTVNGVQVVDNTVTWEATDATYVKWEASPILKSGTTEPTWPTEVGGFVSDGTIAWECVSRRIEDEKCPNSKVVMLGASKIFAVDEDIVRFSATANPKDWSAEQDAGYLPTGMHSGNSNFFAVLAPYRSNLAALNPNGLQLWQIDPDPQAMALLDEKPGIGSSHAKAAYPVGDDLFFLSQLGVRSLGMSGATGNLAAGDVGMPIDVLVQHAIRIAAANGIKFISTFYPGAGQYWLAASGYPVEGLSITGNVVGGYIGLAESGAYTAHNGVLPIGAFSIQSGTFPPGMTLNADGTYTGTYTTNGTYSWVVQVVDADGNVATRADSATVAATKVLLLSTGDLSMKGPRGALLAAGSTGITGIAAEQQPRRAAGGRVLKRGATWTPYLYNAATDQFVADTVVGRLGSECAISPDGNYVVSYVASGGTITYYVYTRTGTTWNLTATVAGGSYSTAVGAIRFSPDGTKLAVATYGSVRVHGFAAGVLTVAQYGTKSGLTSMPNICWSPDSRYIARLIAQPTPSNGSLRVFDTNTVGLPDVGGSIAAGTGNREALCWPLAGHIYCSAEHVVGQQGFHHLTFDPTTGPALATRTMPGASGYVSNIDATPDGAYIAVATYDLGTVLTYALDEYGEPDPHQSIAAANRIALWINHDLPNGAL